MTPQQVQRMVFEGFSQDTFLTGHLYAHITFRSIAAGQR